jgi:Rrf2 family protein
MESRVKVSAKAEYACIALVELAARSRNREVVQIKTIADAHGISPRFLVQILLQLKGAGLVASSRGAGGGYQLARPPQAINLAEVIALIDQAPQAPPGHSTRSAVARELHKVWAEINREEQRILKTTTLADLVQRTQETGVFSFQI